MFDWRLVGTHSAFSPTGKATKSGVRTPRQPPRFVFWSAHLRAMRPLQWNGGAGRGPLHGRVTQGQPCSIARLSRRGCSLSAGRPERKAPLRGSGASDRWAKKNRPEAVEVLSFRSFVLVVCPSASFSSSALTRNFPPRSVLRKTRWHCCGSGRDLALYPSRDM